MAQLQKFQFDQHIRIERLKPYLKLKPEDFASEEFERTWFETLAESSQTNTLGFFDPTGDLKILVDASGNGVGAILLCNDVPIAMFSRETRTSWRHSSDLEIDGLLKALESFKIWTAGRRVRVLTDNWAAYRITNPKNLGKPVMRRLDRILSENPEIEFIPGKDNVLADLLSRNPYLTRRYKKVHSIKIKPSDDDLWGVHREGHVGVEPVIGILKRRGFSVAKVRPRVREIIDCCGICQRMQRHRPRELFRFSEATNVSDVVGIDFIGPLPAEGRKGANYIVAMVDGLTRFLDARLVKSTSTDVAINALKTWIKEHGHIKTIHCDRGSAFTSSNFRRFCKGNDIVLKTAAGSHQSSNGLVERCIQTYANRLRKLSFSTGQPWQSIWKDAMINYNATPHSVTGHAPQELRYGVIEGRQTMSEAELVEARAAAAEKTRRQREYEQDRRKKRIQEDKNEVGDQVLLHVKDRGNRDKMSMS